MRLTPQVLSPMGSFFKQKYPPLAIPQSVLAIHKCPSTAGRPSPRRLSAYDQHSRRLDELEAACIMLKKTYELRQQINEIKKIIEEQEQAKKRQRQRIMLASWV